MTARKEKESNGNRFQNTRTLQKERGILCWRLLCIYCDLASTTDYTSTLYFDFAVPFVEGFELMTKK